MVEQHCKESQIDYETDEEKYKITIDWPVEYTQANFQEDGSFTKSTATALTKLTVQVFSVKDKEGFYCVQVTNEGAPLLYFQKAVASLRDNVIAPAIHSHKIELA